MEVKMNVEDGAVNIKPNEGKVTDKPVVKEEDLVTRVSQYEKPKEEDPKPAGEESAPLETQPKFDYKELENIKDPEAAKAWAQEAYKSFEKGYQKKFQEIADIRKSLESSPAQAAPTSWTPERLQQEMNKSDFKEAAQSIITNQNPTGSGLTDDEYSGMSDKEKTKLSTMEKELHGLKQQQMLNNMRNNMRAEDEKLKTKYANYDPKAMDILTSDMISGKVQAGREDLYKAMMHDTNVRNAYEMGKADKKLENVDKLNSLSPEWTTAVRDDSVPPKEEGESDRAYIHRLGQRNLHKLMDSGKVRK